tara:strand:- start:164 stop:424 length:261 start_codon:yes stop_codon:yes gene_type:complete
MNFPEVELKDNPVLNMLRVNKWIRVNLDRLYLLTHTVDHWQELIEDGSGVTVPSDVVEKLCKINKLTIVKITKGGLDVDNKRLGRR